MVRQLRIEYPGAFYHVISRGIRKENIFIEDNDYKQFTKTLKKACIKYKLKCYAYCLMPNHYHLLVETPEANLSFSMRYLNSTYALFFNNQHERRGHVFQGRYKSMIVEKETYFRTLCFYIIRNPVRAGIVVNPKEYRWSSYHSTLHPAINSSFINSREILSHFHSDLKKAKGIFVRLANQHTRQKLDLRKLEDNCPVLGSKKFVEKFLKRVAESPENKKLTRKEYKAVRPNLKEIFKNKKLLSNKDMTKKIRKAHYLYGYSIKELTNYLQSSYSTICKYLAKYQRD